MANIAYIQVTRSCNQECRFCSNPPTEKTMPLAKAKKIIDDYVRWHYEGVIFSGGEPTLYPHLEDLIRYAHRKKLQARIITNGQKTSERAFLSRLVRAGLRHLVQSVYSDDFSVHDALTKKPGSHGLVEKSLENCRALEVRVDIATVINKYNAPHLSRLVGWVMLRYPFVQHFIWNNLDPSMNRATKNPDTIPALVDFEVELHRAMTLLTQNHKTFRAERVPLCYMSSFQHCSTEARKIVKGEERTVFFLDDKGLKHQKGWAYQKAPVCRVCALTKICPGLFMLGTHFSARELYPVFVSPEPIIQKIRSTP
jgi:MoaA/NifB/PqqE/SkfB family radical SAM enzyme